MAQIARKVPSEAKPRMLNCDLGHSFLWPRVVYDFSAAMARKHVTRSGREIRAFWPLSRKIKSLKKSINKWINSSNLAFNWDKLTFDFMKFWWKNEKKVKMNNTCRKYAISHRISKQSNYTSKTKQISSN